jgi:hypothetical protein
VCPMENGGRQPLQEVWQRLAAHRECMTIWKRWLSDFARAKRGSARSSRWQRCGAVGFHVWCGSRRHSTARLGRLLVLGLG